MKFIADFHIHSKYSRATSPQSDLENLDKWARIKGVDVLGTGDFTHPQWLGNLKGKLEPAEPGLYKLKFQIPDSGSQTPCSKQKTRFILTTEISCVYSKNGKVRKIHILVLAPDFQTVEKINTHLSWVGNLKADGRPTLGLDAKELAKIVLGINSQCLIVPCHLYTPWFSLFGSKSGFDSIEECFEDYSKYIYAGETGLSSSPPMSWRNSSLDRITLISNSDAHSPSHIAREANVFDAELSYQGIVEAIKSKDPKRLLYTIEFYPEEGKYYYDGHRNCGISLSPQETKKYNGICPVCGKPLTIGVSNRIEQLADRPQGFKPKGVIPYKSLVPLKEIISEVLGVGVATKSVDREYQRLIEKVGSELKILLETPDSELKSITLPEIVEGVLWVRQGKVEVEPGYDGVYGKVRIFSQAAKNNSKNNSQRTLFS
ncbi:DNA helicase UvrD [bacterium]|nr:DNA helicase UvrD [bacterium]